MIGAGEYQGELMEVKKYSSLSFGVYFEKNKSGRGGWPPAVYYEAAGGSPTC
jgi:hypothetical protein